MRDHSRCFYLYCNKFWAVSFYGSLNWNLWGLPTVLSVNWIMVCSGIKIYKVRTNFCRIGRFYCGVFGNFYSLFPNFSVVPWQVFECLTRRDVQTFYCSVVLWIHSVGMITYNKRRKREKWEGTLPVCYIIVKLYTSSRLWSHFKIILFSFFLKKLFHWLRTIKHIWTNLVATSVIFLSSRQWNVSGGKSLATTVSFASLV